MSSFLPLSRAPWIILLLVLPPGLVLGPLTAAQAQEEAEGRLVGAGRLEQDGRWVEAESELRGLILDLDPARWPGSEWRAKARVCLSRISASRQCWRCCCRVWALSMPCWRSSGQFLAR